MPSLNKMFAFSTASLSWGSPAKQLSLSLKSGFFSISLLVCEFNPHAQTWYQKFIGTYPPLITVRLDIFCQRHASLHIYLGGAAFIA